MTLAQIDQPEVTAEMIQAVIENPVIYAEAVLGVRLWDKQKEILMSMMNERLVAVKACHGSGKTFMLAVFVLWWLTRYKYQSKVITLAPTDRQVRTVIWSEIKARYEQSPLAQALLDNVVAGDTQIRVSSDSFARGISGSTSTSLQGYHSPNLLICIDESPGVQYEFFEALQGARAGGNVNLIMLGNPTMNSGLFYEAFARPEMGWTQYTISGFDSPNVRSVEIPEDFHRIEEFSGVPDEHDRRLLTYLLDRYRRGDPMMEDTVLPYIFTRQNLVEFYNMWGVNNQPSWYSRALGEFPPEGVDALILHEWMQRAYSEEDYDPEGGPIVFGIDVAGQGEDETVVIGVQEGNVIVCEGYPEMNPFDRVFALLSGYANHTLSIHIDTIGMGFHFALRLSEALGYNFPDVQVIGVNVGVRSSDPARYANLRSQVFWNLREIMENTRLMGVNDSKLRSELLSLKWQENERGQIAMEPKKDMKKRGLSSPDYADALALAVWPAMFFAEMSLALGDEDILIT